MIKTNERTTKAHILKIALFLFMDVEYCEMDYVYISIYYLLKEVNPTDNDLEQLTKKELDFLRRSIEFVENKSKTKELALNKER